MLDARTLRIDFCPLIDLPSTRPTSIRPWRIQVDNTRSSTTKRHMTWIAVLAILSSGSALSESPPPRSKTGEAEMKNSRTITTKILAIGTWTEKATAATRPPVMPFEARDTLRLQLAGKIDQWFAKTDGSGAVFLMNVTDMAEAKALLADLPLGKAGMMTFQFIPLGPLWPLGLLLRESEK
jgi:hypothetical protein